MNLLDKLRSSRLIKGPSPTKGAYQARLKKFWDAMENDSMAVIVSNPERTRSNDTEYAYRQHSDIVYLNGFPEPDSVLVITKFNGKRETVMFVQPKDREREIWTGIREGIEGAKASYFADTAYSIGEFETEIAKLLAKTDKVYYRFRNNHGLDARFRKLWEASQKELLNPDDIIHEMRLFKSKEEIDLIRHAGAISAEGHKQAMLACRPGVTEYQLQAVLEFVFRACGAIGPSYTSIVAGGNNAVILHYTKNSEALESGDIVLIDAACEYGEGNGGYAADITRCFPVSGKFTKAQREIYQLVLDAQLAGIDAAKPGVPLIEVHEEAMRVMNRGLIKLGILPKGTKVPGLPAKNAKAASANGKTSEKKPLTLRDFFMHGTSHWMGIDVHDVGRYDEKDGSQSGDRRQSMKRRLLKPGMVFTIEPGLYFDKDDTRVPKQYRGIGVRIEDDVVITKTGNEILTAGAPKTVAEIETLMAH